PVTDLRTLKKAPIRFLDLGSTPFSDLAQLKEFKSLEDLVLSRMNLTDLSPLAGSGIKTLALGACSRLTSVASLGQLTQLKAVQPPMHLFEVEEPRRHPALKWIGYSLPPRAKDVDTRLQEGRDFWTMNAAEIKARAADPNHLLRPSKFAYMAKRFAYTKES